MSANKLVVISLIILVGLGAWAIFAVNEMDKLGQSAKASKGVMQK